MNKFRKLESLKYLYEIDREGNIRNAKSKKLLKPCVKPDGYVKVCVTINSKPYYPLLHRLVAEAWLKTDTFKYCDDEDISNVDVDKLYVNHKDFNKQNNSADNLEYCTRLYNNRYSASAGHYAGHTNRAIKIEGKNDSETIIFNSSIEAAKYICEKLNKTNVDTVARRIRMCKYAFGYQWSQLKAAETIQ